MDRAEAVIPAHGVSTGPAGATAGAHEARTGTGLRLRAPGARLDPYLLAAVFFVGYTLLSVTRYRQMLTMSWDLGIFEQAVKSYAHLHAPVADLKGPGFNILGDHFSPVTALIAPFYRVFPTPVTLLVAQAVLFAVSVIPVTRCAGTLLGRGRGLAIGTAYALSWGVQKAVEFDFHEIAFAMPMLAFSLEALLLKRWAAAMWWAVPLVFVKEDMGFTAAAIGAVVWWRTRQEPDPAAAAAETAQAPDAPVEADAGRTAEALAKVPAQGGAQAGADRREPAGPGAAGGAAPAGGDTSGDEPMSDGLRYGPWGISLAGFGIAASLLAFAVIIPAFNKSGGYDYWNKLNGHGAPMPGHIPFATATHTLLWILLPTSGLLALRSPLLLAALPTIGWRFVSHDDHYWGTDWHYSAVLMPVVFLALVDAAQRLRDSRTPWLRSYASGVPAAAAGAAVALSLTLPLASLQHTGTYKVDARTKAIEHLLDEIPDGATVEANVGPISRLVHRTTVYWVGDTPGVVPQYIAIDDSSGWVGDPVAYGTQLHPGTTYTEVGSTEGYVVLRRS